VHDVVFAGAERDPADEEEDPGGAEEGDEGGVEGDEEAECCRPLLVLALVEHGFVCNSRLFTYCPKPFMLRLKAARLECNMCLTMSFSSAFSSGVHPANVSPWGNTAYLLSLITDEMVLVCVSGGRISPSAD
jgi:hypothetical protein